MPFCSRYTEALRFTYMLYLARRLAFIYFHPANRVCVFFGPNPRGVLVSFLMMSFHKFHIRYQTNPKPCGWSNNCPRAT